MRGGCGNGPLFNFYKYKVEFLNITENCAAEMEFQSINNEVVLFHLKKGGEILRE